MPFNIPEVREELQGRPQSRMATDLDKRNQIPIISTQSGSGTFQQNLLYFLNGNIDGGDMDGCYPAMDYLDPSSLDGGTL